MGGFGGSGFTCGLILLAGLFGETSEPGKFFMIKVGGSVFLTVFFVNDGEYFGRSASIRFSRIEVVGAFGTAL